MRVVTNVSCLFRAGMGVVDHRDEELFVAVQLGPSRTYQQTCQQVGVWEGRNPLVERDSREFL